MRYSSEGVPFKSLTSLLRDELYTPPPPPRPLSQSTQQRIQTLAQPQIDAENNRTLIQQRLRGQVRERLQQRIKQQVEQRKYQQSLQPRIVSPEETAMRHAANMQQINQANASVRGGIPQVLPAIDPEAERLKAIDYGSPHGEAPLPGYERTIRTAGDVGAAVAGPAPFIEPNTGRVIGETAARMIAPRTPAELVSALATGGILGETTVIGGILRNSAKKAGMRVEEYAASKEGQALIQRLSRGEAGALGGGGMEPDELLKAAREVSPETAAPPPSAGTLAAEGGEPFGLTPEQMGVKSIDDLIFHGTPKKQIAVNFPGGQPVVQGIREGLSAPPPGVGGEDVAGNFLTREVKKEAQATEREMIAARQPFAAPETETINTGRDVIGEGLDKARPAAPKLTPPPALSPITVTHNLNRVEDFLTQVSRAEDDVVNAQERFRTVADQYASQASRRRRIAIAQQKGMTTSPEGLINKNELVRARKEVAQARLSRIKARQALREADIRASMEDIATRARKAGADEQTIQAFEYMASREAELAHASEGYLDLPSWRQRVSNFYARVKGTTPGITGRAMQDTLSLDAGLAELDRGFLENNVAPMEQLLAKEGDNLAFRGNPEFAGLAESDRLYYIYTHPEDFVGKSMELQRLLREAEDYAKARYEFLRQLNPKVAPPVEGRYLPQLWEHGLDHVESVRRPRGRPSTTKPRTIADWRKAKLSNTWNKELADKSPGELIEYATHATRQAISDSYFRRQILRKYGTTVRPKVGSGMAQARNPLFAGWHLPQAISDQVDVLFEPGPGIVRTANQPLHVLQNMRFAIDFSVAGYNVLQALATGNVNMAAGVANRILRTAGMGVDPTLIDNTLLEPRVLRALDGLSVGGAESPIAPRAGTPLQFIPGVGKAVDKPITMGVAKWNNFQYGKVVQFFRDLIAEGNIAMAHFVGSDVNNPAIRRAAMDDANALTGASRGAARLGRREIEGAALSSARITRSQAALIGQVLKKPTNRAEAVYAASVLASVGVSVYGVGLALTEMFGDQPFEFKPFTLENGKPKYNSEWATVPIKGRRYNLIPQRSLAAALAKSIYAVTTVDPAELAAVWSQYGYSRLSPGAQILPTSVGVGFGNRGFNFPGIKGEGLTPQERLQQIAPVPVTGQAALRGDVRDIRTATESTLGLSSYAQSEQQQGEAATQNKNYEAAYQQAVQEGNLGKADTVKTAWRKDFESRAKDVGITVIPGARADAPVEALARGPEVVIDTIDKLWAPYGNTLKVELGGTPKVTYSEQKREYIDSRLLKYMQATKLTEPVAYDDLAAQFDGQPIVKAYKKDTKAQRLDFWAMHPSFLYEAWLLGVEQDNADEREIIDAYRTQRAEGR